MPLYKTHVRFNLLIGFPLIYAGLKYSVALSTGELICFSAAYLYGTCLLHPDLDIAKKIPLFSLKGLLTLPFRPLSYFQKHRGVSHMPLLGTLIRLTWLYIFCFLLYAFTTGSYLEGAFLSEGSLIWYIIAGVGVADLFHIILDRLF